MDFNTTEDINQPQTSTAIVKLVDYTDSEHEDSNSNDDLEENYVGRKGRKKNRKSKPISISSKKLKPNPCLGKKCGNNCSDKLKEVNRIEINEFYWGLPCKSRQVSLLMSCVRKKEIGRKRGTCGNRKASFDYTINIRGGQVKVCQQFLLATLGISQMTLRHNVLNSNLNKNLNNKNKKIAHNKCCESKTNLVKQFIEKLPAVPSHYCRNKSNKLYLPEELRDVSNLYKLYVENLKTTQQETLVVSLYSFRKIYNNDYHLGFHKPKKDKCNICEKFKNMDRDAQNRLKDSNMYKKHLFNKDKSKEFFLLEQAKSKEKNTDLLCASFDLQKVLNTPYGKSMNLFYSRKYAYYNESIYESGTRNGYCFLWGECDGKRGSNEICSVLLKYLTIVDSRKQQSKLSLFCDSCSGQNRNRAILSVIPFFLRTSVFVQNIKLTFLLPGHTMMPVDSIHATIESFIKGRTIWAPSEWPSLISNSRTSPKCYECIVLKHTDFMNWKSYSKAFLPNNIKIKFNSLRSVNFHKQRFRAQFIYGYSENSRLEELNLSQIMRSTKNSNIVKNGPERLYAQQLKISIQKFKDLKNLCEKDIIPQRYHEEYTSMKCDDKIEDTLAESDEDADRC